MALHRDVALPARSGFDKTNLRRDGSFPPAQVLNRRVESLERAGSGICRADIAECLVDREREASVFRNSAELDRQQRAVRREFGAGLKLGAIP
jgi:hypothetical protein